MVIRIASLTLLIAGFLWIACAATFSFTAYQYGLGIWYSQHLPAGDSVPRVEAARAIQEFGVRLKDMHQGILFPATAMLVGGLLLTWSSRPEEKSANSDQTP